jgi:hypothetical protein
MRVILIKIGGVLMICFAILAIVTVFPAKIKSGEAQCWNAAPFIFSLSFMIVCGIRLISYKKRER